MAKKTQVELQWGPLFDHIRKQSPIAANAALQAIKDRTDPLTPRDTGNLIASGSVVDQRLTYTAPYAAKQHEDLSYHHRRGGAKFLERGIRLGRKKAIEAAAKAFVWPYQ